VRGKAASLQVQVHEEEEVVVVGRRRRRREEDKGSSMAAAGHGMAWAAVESGVMIAAGACRTILARGSMPGPASCAHPTLSAAGGAVAAEADRSGLAAACRSVGDAAAAIGGGGGGGGGSGSSSSSSSVGRGRWKGFEGMVAAALLIAVAASTLGMVNGGQVIEVRMGCALGRFIPCTPSAAWCHLAALNFYARLCRPIISSSLVGFQAQTVQAVAAAKQMATRTPLFLN
jgi:hypothetical protein